MTLPCGQWEAHPESPGCVPGVGNRAHRTSDKDACARHDGTIVWDAPEGELVDATPFFGPSEQQKSGV